MSVCERVTFIDGKIDAMIAGEVNSVSMPWGGASFIDVESLERVREKYAKLCREQGGDAYTPVRQAFVGVDLSGKSAGCVCAGNCTMNCAGCGGSGH